MGDSSRGSSVASAAEQLQYFTEGSLVEVSSDEEGFKGAWYVATVLEPPPRSASKRKTQNHYRLYVEYKSLVANDDASVPLREFVDVPFVRPLPPPLTHDLARQSFEIDDVVDACYRDGWWTGVITRVPDNSRFVVTFQNPPDEIEFRASQLRFHQEWLNGEWIRPIKQRPAGLMFSIGKKVEVSFDTDSFHDVWFPAVVLENFQNETFLVEYHNPGIGGEGELLKVTVDYLHIRPSPPPLKDKNFVLLEKVDGFYDFGWRSGVITKELADSRYIVFFKHTNKERELNQTELRPYMEWKDSKWFSASQDVLVPSDIEGHIEHVCNNVDTPKAVLGVSSSTKDNSGMTTPCSFNSEENQTQQPTTCDEKASPEMTSQKKKTKQIPSNGDATYSQPLKKLKEGNAAEIPSLTACQSNTEQMEIMSKETLGGFASPTSANIGTNISNLPLGSSQPSVWGKKARSIRQKDCELDNHTASLVKKRGRPEKSQVTSQRISARAGKEGSAMENAVDSVEKECITKEIGLPVIIGLECNGVRSSRTKKSRQFTGEESLMLTRDQKPQSNNSTIHKIKEGNQSDGKESIQKKRRGRPPKSLIKSPEALVTDAEHDGDFASDGTVIKGGIANEVDLLTIAGEQSAGVEELVVDKEEDPKHLWNHQKLLNGNQNQKDNSSSMKKIPISKKEKLLVDRFLQARGKQQEKHSSKRGKRRSISLKAQSSIRGHLNGSGGKTAEVFAIDCITKEVDMAADKLPSNVSDDQPLSMWFEGVHSPTTADGSRVSPGRTVQQDTKASEREKHVVMQSPAVDVNRILPFVKSTLLWGTIESMEVFRMIPQNPHFGPLGHHKESSREGLAIGSMVTFATVVERTSRLQFGDPRSTIEEGLETLFELESHGFDVEVVRDRLTRLLLIKDKQEQLEDHVKQVNNQMAECNVDKTKIDREIDEIDKQIRELQEKRSVAVSKKEIKDSEIASLHSKAEGISENIWNIKLDFEGLASAPW